MISLLQSSRSAEHPLDSEGIWCEILRQPPPDCPALFLDRDGAVVQEAGYLHRVEDIHIIPGAANVISVANKRNVVVVMVTNQSGVGRGYYGWTEFQTVQNAIIAALETVGAVVNAVYACPHHPEGKGLLAHPNHPARKPNPGMLLKAASSLTLDLESSWLVGDKSDDVEAAKRAGIAGALLVATGYGDAERERAATLASPAFEVRFGSSIADAIMLPVLADRHGA
jgi:D-glycero-D-manno-heptose 1,7-bisphosphate phosphatase